MGELADRRAQIDVRAQSPDGRIGARVRAGVDVEVWFVGGAYRDYTEAQLALQLGQLAALVWVRYRREYLEIGELVRGPRLDEGDASVREREYWQRLEGLRARGRSAGGAVTVASRALTSWEFDVADGTLDRLTEHEFLAELRGAVAGVLAEHRGRVLLLTDEYFDLGLPRWRKEQWRATR